MSSNSSISNDSIDKRNEAYNCNQIFKGFTAKIKILEECNLKCSKCEFWRKHIDSTTSRRMDQTLVYQLINDLAELGCKYLKFSGGEVTLIKDLPNIIAYASQKSLFVGITTNGVLVDEQLAKKLVKAGLYTVRVSIDSPVPEIHDELVGVKSAWIRSTNAVRAFAKYRLENKSSYLRIKIATVVSKRNFRDLLKMVDLAAECGATGIGFLSLIQNPSVDPNLFLSEDNLREFNSEISPLITERCKAYNIKLDTSYPYGNEETGIAKYTGNHQNVELYNRIACFSPWNNLHITMSGRVYACCFNHDPLLGNVKKEKLVDIINGEKVRLLREQCKPPIQIKKCHSCLMEIEQNISIWNMLFPDKLFSYNK